MANQTPEKKIKVCGFDVRVINFGYASYFYPEFNGNAEFPVNSKGFRQLSHYLRTTNYHNRQMGELFPNYRYYQNLIQ